MMINLRYFLFLIFEKRLEYTHIKNLKFNTILSKKVIPEYCKGDHPWNNDRLQDTDDHVETQHIKGSQNFASWKILVSLSEVLFIKC